MLAADLPRIVITMGDPAGIGPEIIARALSEPSRRRTGCFTVLGDPALMRESFQRWGAPQDWQSVAGGVVSRDGAVLLPAEEGPPGEAAEAAWIRKAVRGCLEHRFDALCTAPICKSSLYARGFAFPGHTEFLGALAGIEAPIMAFVAPGLRVSLITVHLPLAEVPSALTREKTLETLRTTHQAARDWFGIEHPRIALCGLNPHAGERGHLGREDLEVLMPAVEDARQEGMDVSGPLPADTLFPAAARGRYDWVVACYHDQGLIPVKVLAFGQAVNVTLGLPLIRTSVDHGVAYDIAGRGVADASSMGAALDLAVTLANRRRR